MLIYVDDIIVTGNSRRRWQHHLVISNKILLSKILEIYTIFFGIEVKQDQEGIVLSQEKYAWEILNRVGIRNCKSSTTPMSASEKL